MQLLIHAGLGQPDHLNHRIEAVDAVGPADIQRVVENYLIAERRVVGLFDRAEAKRPQEAATDEGSGG